MKYKLIDFLKSSFGENISLVNSKNITISFCLSDNLLVPYDEVFIEDNKKEFLPFNLIEYLINEYILFHRDGFEEKGKLNIIDQQENNIVLSLTYDDKPDILLFTVDGKNYVDGKHIYHKDLVMVKK